MADLHFASEQFTKTWEQYRKTGKRRWTLVETNPTCIVDTRFIAKFLQNKVPGRETRTMHGDTIVITSYSPDASEKIVTKFIPAGK
jgi:hypothetical protein